MASIIPIRMPNPDFTGVRVLDDLAAMYSARGYLREFLHSGEVGAAIEAHKELENRIGKPPTKKKVDGQDAATPGHGKLLEWHEVRDKKWAVQAWRSKNDDALPPLAPRNVHAKLPGLRAKLTANGAIALYTTDGKSVEAGDTVVVKPHLEGDVNYSGRRGKILKIILTDEEDAKRQAGKEVKDFKGASITIQTENGTTYAGKVDRFGPLGSWAPEPSKTPDPDARETRLNASWFRQPEPIAPWCLLAQLISATERHKRCTEDYQKVPNSEDAFMFFKAAEEHLDRVQKVWAQWAMEHPLEADKCRRLHESSMRTAGLDIPLPASAMKTVTDTTDLHAERDVANTHLGDDTDFNP